jgi:cell division protein FtsI (penicillin-binding protein 3)
MNARINNLTKTVKQRIRLVRAFLCLLFIGILARGVFLQIVQAEELRAKAARQSQRNITIHGERGSIFDINKEKLAVSVQVDSWYACPKEIEAPNKTAKSLSDILGKKQAYYLNLFKKHSSFVWVERKVAPDLSDRLKEAGLPGIHPLRESRRYYPNMSLAAQVLGFVGQDNQGLGGIEYKYDTALKGHSGVTIIPKDARGRPFTLNVTQVAPSADGYNFVLTIDKEIQFIAERALMRGVTSSKAASGMAVVMRPDTGEVLAIANSPSFDPNNFSKFKNEHIRNRVVTDVFEPGSSFKPFVAAAALEEGKAKLSDVFDCENGVFYVDGLRVRDDHKYEELTLDQVIRKSSNIGILKLGFILGPKMLYKYTRAFGFGERTGIDLPAESPGLLSHYENWNRVELANNAFGQGTGTTAMQLITAFSAIANGGNLMRPYVIKQAFDSKGRLVTQNGPRIVRRVISERTASEIKGSLVGVVSPQGTAPNAKVPGFTVAGKTGTAQIFNKKTGEYSRTDYNAVFGGFLPADDPELCILVVINKPRTSIYGSVIAVPVFQEIARHSVNYFDIKPKNQPQLLMTKFYESVKNKNNDEKRSSRGGDNQRVVSGSLPDFTGMTMREVLREVSRLQINVKFEGSGVAISQKPRPGTDIEKINRCLVKFGLQG